MKKTTLILTLFTFGLTLGGQNFIDYFNVANEAEHDFIESGNISSAKNSFISLEKKYGKLLYKDYFYLGILNYLDNDTANGFLYLVKFTKLFGSPTNYIPDYKNKFPKLKISARAMSLLESLEKKNKLSFKDTLVFNKQYKPVIDSVKYYLNLDQLNRQDPANVSIETDNQIQRHYLNYLKKYGLPDPHIFGDEYLIILFHIYDLKVQADYLAFFQSEISKGNAYPFIYALITDKRLQPAETVYGSFSVKSSPNTSIDQVIENRKKIGMSVYYNWTNHFPRTFTKETFEK